MERMEQFLIQMPSGRTMLSAKSEYSMSTPPVTLDEPPTTQRGFGARSVAYVPQYDAQTPPIPRFNTPNIQQIPISLAIVYS